jgi:hypothetical protein
MVASFKELVVWQKAIELSLVVYKLTGVLSPGRAIRLDQSNTPGICFHRQ